MITWYELTRDGHSYYSPVDEPEHLDPGDIDSFGRCMHGIVSCIICRIGLA